MFYKLFAMMLVVAGLTWIGADPTTVVVVGLLLAANNMLAWLIKFAFAPSNVKATYHVEDKDQNPFAC